MYLYVPVCNGVYQCVLVLVFKSLNSFNYSFRGTHRDAAMLPGPSEKTVPEVQPALDDDLDPIPCEEDEDVFKARPNADEWNRQ